MIKDDVKSWHLGRKILSQGSAGCDPKDLKVTFEK